MSLLCGCWVSDTLASQECGQPCATSKHLAILRHAGSQVPPQLLQHLTELNGFKKLGCRSQDRLTELSYSVIFGEPCLKNLNINSLHKVFTDFKIRASYNKDAASHSIFSG